MQRSIREKKPKLTVNSPKTWAISYEFSWKIFSRLSWDGNTSYFHGQTKRYVQSTTSMYLKTKLAIRTEKAERNDKNDCKNQVFAAKTILNYLRTGNREFIRCSVLFAVREITKQPDFPSGIVNFCHGTFRLGPLKLTHLALKHNCRSFGQTHRCSSSLANSPMSDSFLEEDQLSKCNVGAAGNSCVFFIVRLRVKMSSSLPEVGVRIYSTGEKNHARNKHRATWIFPQKGLKPLNL